MKMNAAIEIQVPEDIIASLDEKLNGLKNPKAAMKTITNNAAKKVQAMLIKKASKKYVGKAARQSPLMAASSIHKGSVGSQVATINFRSPVHEIKEFHVSSLEISNEYYHRTGKRKKPPQAKVLSGSSKVLDHAFVVEFKNGHISVVGREPGTHMRSNPRKEKLKKILSPSYKVMIGGKQVYETSSDAIGVILHNEAEKILDKLLGGK